MTLPGSFHLTPVSTPIGSVITYLGNITNNLPTANFTLFPEAQGWMLCDGRTLNSSQYPELFSVLGYLYGGSGDSFNIPDLRGMFLRGISNSQAALENRTAAPGGNADGVGSTQPSALQNHVHNYHLANPTPAGGTSGELVQTTTSTSQTGTPEQLESQSTVNTSNLETRPDNIFVYYLIKYTSQLPTL